LVKAQFNTYLINSGPRKNPKIKTMNFESFKINITTISTWWAPNIKN
jgi:hypothetical protein